MDMQEQLYLSTGGAEDKIEAMRSAGIVVAESPAKIGHEMFNLINFKKDINNLAIENRNYFTRLEELKNLFVDYKKDKKLISYEWQKFFDDLTPDAENFLNKTEIDDFKNIKIPNLNNSETNIDLNTKSSTLDPIRALMLIRATE